MIRDLVLFLFAALERAKIKKKLTKYFFVKQLNSYFNYNRVII